MTLRPCSMSSAYGSRCVCAVCRWAVTWRSSSCASYRDRVRSLVLCDTRSVADTPEAAAGAPADWPTSVVVRGSRRSWPRRCCPSYCIRTRQPRQPLVAEAVREMILATDPRGIAAAQRGMAERSDATDLLPTIKVRTPGVSRRIGRHQPARRDAKAGRGDPAFPLRGRAGRGAHGAAGKPSVRQRRVRCVPGQRAACAVSWPAKSAMTCRRGPKAAQRKNRPQTGVRSSNLIDRPAHMSADTPASLGYRMPAEWEPHVATWLSWPHNLESWPGQFEPIPGVWAQLVRTLARIRAGPHPGRRSGGARSGPGDGGRPAERRRSTTSRPTTPGRAITARCF